MILAGVGSAAGAAARSGDAVAGEALAASSTDASAAGISRQSALIIIGSTHADHMNMMAATGADDLEKVELAVQPFVLVQADNQRYVLEETRCLADLVPQIRFELIVVEVVKLQRRE